jgi:hypothetical protein
VLQQYPGAKPDKVFLLGKVRCGHVQADKRECGGFGEEEYRQAASAVNKK